MSAHPELHEPGGVRASARSGSRAVAVLRKSLRRPRGLVRTATLRMLSKVERALLDASHAPRFAPVFVIGLPRVGSTLVYQALVRRFTVSYLCNAAAGLPDSPALVSTALCRMRSVAPSADFRNFYGVTRGWNGPAQAREVWGRWFPEDQSHVGPGTIGATARAQVRATVALIERAFGMPFANKTQGHAVRIEALCEIFADAVFIRVNRDRLEVAESILRGRRDYFGDERHWFSAKPSNFEQLAGCGPFDQIAGQIRGIEGDMARAFNRVGVSRLLEVDYREFCSSPLACLDGIRDFYEERSGTRLQFRGSVPEVFEVSQRERVTPAESRLLREALENMEAGC